MIFLEKLSQLINPIWYFNIKTGNKNEYWVDHLEINSEFKKILDINNYYESQRSFNEDLAYQCWHKGFIHFENNILIKDDSKYEYSTYDQYIFLRRMFKPKWVYYSFFIRFFTFQITFKEIKAIIKTRFVKPINLNSPIFQYNNYSLFESSLLSQKPLISIIIPTLNRYEYIKMVLSDLEKQIYRNFEVIIIDQSDDFDNQKYKDYKIKINLIFQKEKKLWKARNRGIKIAKGDYLLFLDDDSRFNSNWIYEHIKCIDFFQVDISAGVSISKLGSPTPKHYNYFRWADQLDTGNVMIKKNVFEICGLFDERFEGMRMGDGEFGLRAYMKGFKSINNPLAKRDHLKVAKGGLREIGSWDGIRSTNWFGPKPIPSILYFFRKYWGDKNSIFYLLKVIPISLSPYSIKGKNIGIFLSLIYFILFFPIIFFQVCKSWKISSRMLSEGAKIDRI